MGGALGLAILASVAAHRTNALLSAGGDRLQALACGYQAAFLLGAIFAALAALTGALLLRTPVAPPA
jgi:hypothetical protein